MLVRNGGVGSTITGGNVGDGCTVTGLENDGNDDGTPTLWGGSDII